MQLINYSINMIKYVKYAKVFLHRISYQTISKPNQPILLAHHNTIWRDYGFSIG